MSTCFSLLVAFTRCLKITGGRGAAALLGVLPVPLVAQGASANIEPIAQVRMDADQDGKPDRTGERVTVAGWVTVETGRFHPGILKIFIQDETAGIGLFHPAQVLELRRGQRVLVSGEVSQFNGITELKKISLRPLPTEPRELKPRDISIEEAVTETYEGQLVRVRADILRRQRVSDGYQWVLAPIGALQPQLLVYVSDRLAEEAMLKDFVIGKRMRITGILAQHDLHEPYDSFYSLWPRSAADLEYMPPGSRISFKDWTLLGVILLLVAAWLLSLRYRVAAKTRQLRYSEERFRSVFEGAVDGILLQDMRGIVRLANPAAETLFRADQNPLEGRDFTRLLASATRQDWEAMIETVPIGEPVSLEGRIICLDGTQTDAELSVSQIELDEHSMFLVFARDITERMRVQNALNQQKERLQVTLSSIGDGVIVVNTKSEITMMNRAAERLTGWKENRALSRPLDDVISLVNSKTAKEIVDPVALVLSSGGLVELPGDTDMVDRNGVRRQVLGSLAPLRDAARGVQGVVLAFRDITDQLKREDEMTNAAKLESIGVLAGGIAHDFNNILTSVLGNVSLARSEDADPAEIRGALEEAEKAAIRARDLTRQLLTFSKGGAPIRKAASIEKVIRESAGFALSGSNVSCNYIMGDNLWPVEVDEGQIIQVINNLVINAMDAMPDGGRLEITAENWMLDEQTSARDVPLPPGRYVRVTVSDSGKGIASEDLVRIFDPYFTTKPTGSGLGLAASYSIINNHEGYITVDSREGVGSTFTFYLPVSGTSVQPRSRARPKLVKGQGRVLVMDDEPAVRRVACLMLKRLGYEYDEAEDGEEALTKYREALDQNMPYGAVIMDLTIPGGMGGREAITKLLNLDPNAVAIVSSGYSNDLIMADYQHYGFSGVVMKPYDVHTLGETLAGLIQSPMA